RNEAGPALATLADLGLAEYFLCPQIHWGAKSASIAQIARDLNLGLDSFAFVDDQPFERDEVRSEHPTVWCLAPEELEACIDTSRFIPRFVTEDSSRRRAMYRGEMDRREAEASFAGPKQEFLSELGMVFRVGPVRERDLERAEELTVRTNQLNST